MAPKAERSGDYMRVRYFRFRFGDVFGDGTDPLARWVFSIASAANDALFIKSLLAKRGVRGRFQAAESFYLWRVACAQVFECCQLLFAPKGENLKEAVPKLLQEIDDIQEDLAALRAARFGGTMYWEGDSPGRMLRLLTYHSPNPRDKDIEVLWQTLGSLADETAETVVPFDQRKWPRYFFVDKVFSHLVDRLFPRYDAQMAEFDTIVNRFGHIAVGIIPHYVAIVRGVEPESAYGRLRE